MVEVVSRGMEPGTGLRVADLRPIERHELMARMAGDLGLTLATTQKLSIAHERWLDEIGRPLIEAVDALRANARIEYVHSTAEKHGAQPRRSSSPQGEIIPHVTVAEISNFSDPTTAFAAYWSALLERVPDR
jgi:hypothetical protein